MRVGDRQGHTAECTAELREDTQKALACIGGKAMETTGLGDWE